MKVLWGKAGGLVPPDTAGKIGSYNLLRELARDLLLVERDRVWKLALVSPETEFIIVLAPTKHVIPEFFEN